jgi:hypothetical protein
MLAYTIMNGLSGPIIDRVGTKLGYALTIAWWSAAEVLHAFSRGVVSLGIFRFLLGMGQAGNWPAAVRVVAEWFPAEERALASGIFNKRLIDRRCCRSTSGCLDRLPHGLAASLPDGWPKRVRLTGGLVDRLSRAR